MTEIELLSQNYRRNAAGTVGSYKNPNVTGFCPGIKKNHVYLVPKTFVLRMRTFSGPFFRWKVAAGPYLQKASHPLGAQQQTDKTPKEMLT